MFHQRVSGFAETRGLVPPREEGQGMVEYGLILSFVALIVVAALIVMGPKVSSILRSSTLSP